MYITQAAENASPDYTVHGGPHSMLARVLPARIDADSFSAAAAIQ